MKKAQLLIGLLIAVWLVGCGSTVVPLEPVDLSEMTGYSTNRHTVAAQVEIKKADVLIEALKLEFERQKIINKKEPMPQIRNKDELIIWLMQKSNDNIKEIVVKTNDIHPSIFQLLLVLSKDKKVTIDDEFNQRFFDNLKLAS